MDELELSGRPHISAKRAAREHRYHSDYIGQLIRSGKVAGQKVGRSWYVDIESLGHYLKGEPQSAPAQAAPVAAAPATAPAATPAPEPAGVREPAAASVPQPEPSMSVAAEKNNVVSAPVSAPESHPIKISKPDIPVEERAPVGLRFVPDEEPLPAVHTMHTAASHASPMRERHEEEIMRPRARMALVSVAGAGACALILALGALYIMEQHIIVAGESSSASIYFSFLR
ncbi:MAG: hypothetical protein AAB964_01950 [Patescibacteria group bacterium]